MNLAFLMCQVRLSLMTRKIFGLDMQNLILVLMEILVPIGSMYKPNSAFERVTSAPIVLPPPIVCIRIELGRTGSSWRLPSLEAR